MPTTVWTVEASGSGVGTDIFATRAALVAAVAAGYAPIDGTVIFAGGPSYIAQAGATAIPDLPGLVPISPVRPEHFGNSGEGYGVAITLDGADRIAATEIPDEVTHVFVSARDSANPDRGGASLWAAVSDNGTSLRPGERRSLDGRRWSIIEPVLLPEMESAGVLRTGEAQFDVGQNWGISNRYRIDGGPDDEPPVLRVTGPGADIDAAIVPKGNGDFVVANGIGTLFRVDGAGSERVYRWITLFASRTGNPAISSQSGVDTKVSGASEYRILSDDEVLFSVSSVASSTPARMTATLGDTFCQFQTDQRLFLNAGAGKDISFRDHISTVYTMQPASDGGSFTATESTALVVLVRGSATGVGGTTTGFTVNLPPNPVDGRIFSISSDHQVNSLTINAGATPASTGVIGAPTSLGVGAPIRFIYLSSAGFNKWVRF